MTSSKQAPALPVPRDFNPVVTLYNGITIAAAPLTVLTVLLDTSTWNSWNTCNRYARIYLRPETPPSLNVAKDLAKLVSQPSFLSPGCKVREKFWMKGTDLAAPAPEAGSQASNIEVVSIEEFQTVDGRNGFRIIWKLIDWSEWMMLSRRVHEFVETGPQAEETEYRAWTELGGLAAWAVKWTSAETMKTRFDEAFVSLKSFVETGAKAER